MLFTPPVDALLPSSLWRTYMLSFCPRANMWLSWSRPQNQNMIPQERLQSPTMHCTYLLALSENLGACAHVRIEWWLASEQSWRQSCLVASLPISLAPKWFAVLSVARQHRCPSSWTKDICQTKSNVFVASSTCGKEMHCCLRLPLKDYQVGLDSLNSNDWEPESASTVQDLACILHMSVQLGRHVPAYLYPYIAQSLWVGKFGRQAAN